MKSFTSTLQELNKDNVFLPIPEDVCAEMGIREGDEYELKIDEGKHCLEIVFLKFKK